ncbi:MAG: hypothetical protein ABII22_02855 [Candidatus Micrarchaeota archaeon]
MMEIIECGKCKERFQSGISERALIRFREMGMDEGGAARAYLQERHLMSKYSGIIECFLRPPDMCPYCGSSKESFIQILRDL